MGWYSLAIRDPGPSWKQNGGVNACHGVVCHSMVGGWPAARNELMRPDRRASWHFSVLKDGSVYQAYDTGAQTWHAGSARNNDLIGIEHEGGLNPYNEPLTPSQLNASIELIRWCMKSHGFAPIRGQGLFEHNEVSGAPTSCPSGRIPWPYILAALQVEEDDVKPYFAWDHQRQRVYFVTGGAAGWCANQATADELAKVYGLPVPAAATVALSTAALKALGADA